MTNLELLFLNLDDEKLYKHTLYIEELINFCSKKDEDTE